MSEEIRGGPQPTPKQEKIAERWMQTKGVHKPTEPKVSSGGLFGKVSDRVTDAFRKIGETPAANPTVQIGEAYDLFVEKGDLQSDIVTRQRHLMDPIGKDVPEPERWKTHKTHLANVENRIAYASLSTNLTLEQKLQLIKEGRIGTLSHSADAGLPVEVIQRNQARIGEIDAKLNGIFSQPGLYEKFQENLSHQIRVRHQAREVKNLDKFSEQTDVLAVKLTREAQVQGRALTSVERQIIEDNQAIKQGIVQRRQELLKDPEVFDRVRIMNLQEYQRQIKKDRFAETPSRKAYLRKIEEYWAEAKKVLLTGQTGTGKTEMVKHASNMLFGVNPEPVTGHQDMSIYELLGKTGFRVQEGDVFRPAPLVRAMTGRDGKGQPFLFDEIDRAPNQSVMGIKTILNARPGEKGIRVQTDSAGSFDVGEDYAVAATANIKSEKHATATELDPAIVRVFDAPMDIDYIPAPEVYDLALASLMDNRGGIPLSENDAKTLLKSLCDAASWIQDAYQGRQVMTDPSSGTILEARGQATTGKAASLKKALLDPGRTLDMLNGWSAAQIQGVSLEEYLNQRVVEFVNNRAYPDEDRYYLTEIFALKGFLKGRKANELMVDGLTQDTLDRWSGATTTRAPKPATQTYLSADRVAKLDPYRRFKRPASADAEDLLADEEIEEETAPAAASVVSGRYKALKDIVGDITLRDKPKGVHLQYIQKLTDLGQQPTSLTEKKQAIALLDEYAKNGAYNERGISAYDVGDGRKLTDIASERSTQIRLKVVNTTDNFSTIKDFVGDITQPQTKELHLGYINRIFDLGSKGMRTPGGIPEMATNLLDEYAKNGAYNERGISTYDVGDGRKLTDIASEKAAQLRSAMMKRL